LISSDADRTAWFGVAARALADNTRAGSLARKAALCVGVALANSKTPTGARKVLADVRPDVVRDVAVLLLDHLTEEAA
jgi:hypothetical protein